LHNREKGGRIPCTDRSDQDYLGRLHAVVKWQRPPARSSYAGFPEQLYWDCLPLSWCENLSS